MGLQGFSKFHQLLKLGCKPSEMGFGTNVQAGDINRFASRLRLARSFQGINLEGYSQETISGYDAFLQVFLTHSALERFLEINSLKLNDLASLMAPYGSEKFVQEFFEKDKNNLLYEFLIGRLDDKPKIRLNECKNFNSTNVAYISASIRHIFAHGHLCAHANGINPKTVYSNCILLSDFLLNFMDSEFTKRVEKYYNGANLSSRVDVALEEVVEIDEEP